MNRYVIANLVHHQHVAPTLARWHTVEWGHLYASSVWNRAIAEREFAEMNATEIPLTIVALDPRTNNVVGSISLIADDDLEGFEHCTPWLASLYVAPTSRGCGIARALIDSILSSAAELGNERVFLFTSGQEDYYRNRGWALVARTQANGHDAAVMARSTSPHGARRALVTQWTSNPNYSGTYSHLHPGGTPKDRQILAEPVHQSLWFAGEAMSTDYPGTLHGAWFSGELAAQQLHATKCTADVVVVGAGLAGLASATALHTDGHRVVVLEAESHAGGRAHTDRSLGVPVHTGGTWMHGTDRHPISAFGLRSLATDFSQTPVLSTHGPPLVAADLHAALESVETALDEQAGKQAGQHSTNATDSYTDEMAKLEELEAVVTNAAREFARAHAIDFDQARQALAAVLRGTYENLYSAPPNSLSLRFRAEPYRLLGDDCMIVDPLDTMVGPMAAALDVRLNHQVSLIDRRDSKWSVATVDGNRFDCDAVIITAPIGSLQQNRIRFNPPLPDRFTTSLNRLGPGAVAKAFFTFDDKFWVDRSWYVAANPPVVFDLWVDISELTNQPTLCAFAAASVASQAEAMSEHELCIEADQTLATVRMRL
jgi:monoamine oxidase/predicted N-acetyltransferase YhbS